MKEKTSVDSSDRSRTIMIVDDDPLIRCLTRRIVEHSGYTVVAEANDGMEAIARYSEDRPHITLMDVCMPNKNGFDATRDIVSFDRNAKVVMCSAAGHGGLQEMALEVGAAEVIFKPFRINHLRKVLHKVFHT